MVKVTKKKDAEMSKGGKLKQLQDEANKLGKVVAKITGRPQAEIKVATVKDEETKIKTYEGRIKEGSQPCYLVFYYL